jgi:spermidine/putrescine ABC transporter ATP-binding subunit
MKYRKNELNQNNSGNSSKYVVFLENLTKRFGDIVAVDAITLGVKKGEFLTLLGPSGSGKTTILMMIAGFQLPTSGEIFIEGEIISSTPPFNRNVGMVFQSYALFPHMTVFENIAFPLRMRKFDKSTISKSVKKMLKLVKLIDYHTRYPKQLSGGQQQRIALARALVYNPPVLLMDEPLGALDKKLREHMQLEIKQIQKELGITVIYVTHDQEEALTMSDRIAILNASRIEQVGSPDDIYERPKNKFVGDFIGETNILDAEVTGEKNGMIEIVTSEGLKIVASKQHTISTKNVSILIRPERIGFIAASKEGLNTYEGIIEETIYLGDTCKYKVRIGGKETVVVTKKNDHKTIRYVPGNPVLVAWEDEDMNIVRE